MDHEERDIYIIPPNFIEGGTLFGGMFKTRNVVEAGILALITGIPVLSLSLSLTTRIILLCLTALPLAMLALIGVSGGSLSSFIFLFFVFLRNRRTLTREGQPENSEKKTPSILAPFVERRRAETSAANPSLPRSRRRFQVNLKERKLRACLRQTPIPFLCSCRSRIAPRLSAVGGSAGLPASWPTPLTEDRFRCWVFSCRPHRKTAIWDGQRPVGIWERNRHRVPLCRKEGVPPSLYGFPAFSGCSSAS